jgi:hypothetical protein
MSRLGINTGSNPNDGQGDPLRVAMGKINSNFTEIYNTLGDGNNVTSYASTAGISTVARNLTGNPIINVSGILNTGITTTEHLEVRNITSIGVVTAVQFVGDGSQLSNVTSTASGISIYDDGVFLGVAREIDFDANIVSTAPDGTQRVKVSSVASYASTAGIATYATKAGFSTIAGYASTAGISTVSQGLTGTPNINVGVVTATSFFGSGTNLTGIVTQIVAGTNVTISGGTGSVTINSSGGGGSQTLNETLGFGNTSNLGMSVGVITATRLDTTTTGTPTIGAATTVNIDAIRVAISTDATIGRNLNVSGIVTATQFVGDGSLLTNVPGSVNSGYANTAGIATVAQGLTGTPNIVVGVVTATQFVGDGSGLTGIVAAGSGVVIQEEGSSVGTAATINFVGTAVTATISGGVATIQVSSGSGIATYASTAGVSTYASTAGIATYASTAGVSTYATSSGIATYASTAGVSTYATSAGVSTVSQGLTGTPNINVGVVTATRLDTTTTGTPTIGAATTVNIDAIRVAISTDATVGRNLSVSGIVTATNGFISVGNTTPIQISLVGNKLTFTAVGIGSTTLTLF